jgi:SAM-dependent methyltransferase
VLDIACGKAGPALILAAEYGCRLVGVEQREGFASEARTRIAAAGLGSLIEVHTADAAAFEIEPESWDAALCLGASFVWGTIADTAPVLARAVRSGGFVAIGEPYWRVWPVPEGIDAGEYVALEKTVDRFHRAGLELTGLIAASEDDWDHYESLHWRALEETLAENPDAELRAQHERHRNAHVARRSLFGWAIFVGRKP